MEVIDSGEETQAGADAVDRSDVHSTIKEVEIGDGNGSSEKVDKDREKVPHVADQANSTGKSINIREEECRPLLHEGMRISIVKAETMSVSEVDEPVPGVAGSCHCVSAQHNLGNIPCDIQEAQAVFEEEFKAVIVDEPSVGGDQVDVKDVPSSNECDNIAESIDIQQEKEKCCTDGYADVGRSKGECLADVDAGEDATIIVKCGNTIRKDDEPEPYVGQVQIHPNTTMEIQVTHMADAECQKGHHELEGDASLVQIQAKIVVEDISFTEENPCIDHRITGHSHDNHLDVTNTDQESNVIGTVCHMTEESETSLNLVGIEVENLNKAGDVVKALDKVAEVGNGTELTMNVQSVTEENYRSVDEAMNHEAVDEHFQGAEDICLSEDNNPNEGVVVDCTDGMDVDQEVIFLQMKQKETITLTGETEGVEQSVLVVEANQNYLQVDNSMHQNETNTHNDPVGSGPNFLNVDPSAEAFLSKSSDFDDKNVSYNAGDSIECPNTMSNALVTSESRDPCLAHEDPISKQDVTVPPALSNIESHSSDVCSTYSNLMDKEYFIMEGLNLSVEISMPMASEVSEIQDVISQDIESAVQINSLEDKLENPGGDMNGEHGPYTGSEKQTMKQWPEYKENDQRARYYIVPEEKHSFSISDLVWGKVKSHPWWPGQIFDPSYASELALKHKKKDSFLVAYFGDKTFAWCDESQLKPFEQYFSQMEKQSSSDVFVNAIDDALKEVFRRTELGMACFCYLTEASSLACQKVENAGIREGSNSCVVGKSHIVSCFHPIRLVNYAKDLARMPFGGADRLELSVAKVHLKAFYMSKGYLEPPVLQNSGWHSESGKNIYQSAGENVGKGSLEHMIPTPSDSKFGKYKLKGRGSHSNKQMTDSGAEKTLFELTYADVACDLANGGRTETGAEFGGEMVTVYTGNIRKAPDSDSSDSDRRKRKKLDSLGDMESKLQSSNFSSSFKVGECIRRVASQLAGSPSILRANVEASYKNASKDDSVFDVFVSDASPKTVMHSPKMKMTDPEDYSPDELLSQLCAAAVDPIMGFKFVETQFTFFSVFRNFCVVSSTEQRLLEKGKRGRKRKVESRSLASSMLITDHMQDTYWSNLASCQSPVNDLRNKEATTGRSQRRKRNASRQTSLPRSSVPLLQIAEYRQIGSPTMTSSLIVEQSIIRVEEKMVVESSPTALILNFNGLKPLPSEKELTRIFSRYGPLKEASTEVQTNNNFVKVVFKRCADAEIAFSNTGKHGIFGPSLLSYRLRYLPLTSVSSPDTELHESDAIPLEDVTFEILDTCQATYMSLDTKSGYNTTAVPVESSDLETLYNCSIVYTSSDSKSEEKDDAVPVKDTIFEDPDSQQDVYASSDTKLQVKNDVVAMEVSCLEIMDSSQAAYDSPHICSEQGDAVPMEDNNLETAAICQGNASLYTESRDKDDPVPLEGRNLEIPYNFQIAYDSQDTKLQDKITERCEAAYASPDTCSQDKGDAVPMEDRNLVTLDICQANASLDTEFQDNDDAVPLENRNLEILYSCQAAFASQDTKSQGKNNAIPVEDSSIVTLDICQGKASADIKSQDKNGQVPLEDGNIEIPESCEDTSDSQDTSSQDKNDAVPLEDTNLETPDPSQGNGSPDTKSLDKSDPVPLEESNLEISDSFHAASVSRDVKSRDKSDVVPMEDGNHENSDTCQGNSSPDTKSQGKNVSVPTEDSNPEISESPQIAVAFPDSKSQNKNGVPIEYENLEISDTCQDSEDKKDPVFFEGRNCAPGNCHAAFVSSDIKSTKGVAVTFEDSSIRASDDYQTACTSSETTPQDKIDAIATKDANLENPDNGQIACASPDSKPEVEVEVDAVPIKCSHHGTTEYCQTPGTKSQEK